MNKSQADNPLNVNDNLQLFEQMTAIMEMSGIEVNADVKELLQPYLDGKEPSAETIQRLQALLAEVK